MVLNISRYYNKLFVLNIRSVILSLTYFLNLFLCQITDCAVGDRVVCVIPERLSDDYSDKLGSLLRVNELGLLCAILNGRLDPSMLKSPCGE